MDRPTKKRKSDPNATASTSGSSAPKRAKTVKTSRIVGRLAGLLTVPLDVLFEIFGKLHPLDLLRLSRTSKDFRNLLMHKSSVSIWKSCLSNICDLPACPPGMDEPQWANLLFDKSCQVCMKGALNIDWALFVRICSKCTKLHIRSTAWARLGEFSEGDPEDYRNYEELIPTRKDRKRGSVYFDRELQSVKAKYRALEGPEQKKKYVEDRKELVKALGEHTAVCDAWSVGMAYDRSTELSDLRRERLAAITAKLTELGWGAEINSIMPPDYLRNHKLVKEPRALSERTWTNIKPQLLEYMEEMKKKRLSREYAAILTTRRKVATGVLGTFKQSCLPWTDFMPEGPDFWDFPKIRDLIKEPAEVDINQQSFEALLPLFPEMIAEWRENVTMRLVRQVKLQDTKGTGVNSNTDEAVRNRLKLATTVFTCKACTGDEIYFDHWGSEDLITSCKALYWPRVLSHRCLNKSDLGNAWFLAPAATVLKVDMLKLDTSIAEIVEKVVIACGLDPATATVEDMDKADPRLACHTCAIRSSPASASSSTSASASTSAAASTSTTNASVAGPAQVKAYSWRNAVRHEGDAHDCTPTAWHLVGDEEAAKARIAEGKLMATSRSEGLDAPEVEEGADSATRILPTEIPEVVWSCALCLQKTNGRADDPPMSWKDIQDHLNRLHAATTARPNESCYRALAAPEIYGSTDPFPATQLRIEMPPAPPMKAKKKASVRFNPWGLDMDLDMGLDMYDSDEDLYGRRYDSDEGMYGLFPW